MELKEIYAIENTALIVLLGGSIIQKKYVVKVLKPAKDVGQTRTFRNFKEKIVLDYKVIVKIVCTLITKEDGQKEKKKLLGSSVGNVVFAVMTGISQPCIFIIEIKTIKNFLGIN